MSAKPPNVVLVSAGRSHIGDVPTTGPGWCRFERTLGEVGGAEAIDAALRSDLVTGLPTHRLSSRAELGIGGGRRLGRVRKRRPVEPWLLVDDDPAVLDLLPVDDLIVVIVGLPEQPSGPAHEDALLVDLRMHVPPSVEAVPARMRWARSTSDIAATVQRLARGGQVEPNDLFGPERHRRIVAELDGARVEFTHPLTQVVSGDLTGELVSVYDDGAGALTPPSDPGAPMRAVTVVVDFDEFEHNLRASPDVRNGAIDLEVIDNRGNAAGSGIAGLYAGSATAASIGPVLFVHPDVYLPAGWVDRTRRALQDLDTLDPDWAVAGIAGRLRGSIDAGDTGRGRWSDPHGYRGFGELPMPVDVLDELILITRDRSIGFDPEQPGFHCYGTDLAATAQEAGRTIWVIDNWAWHKRFRSDGTLLTHADRSGKITNRAEVGFTDEFTLSAAWVRDKWAGRQPLQGMTEYWRDFYGEG